MYKWYKQFATEWLLIRRNWLLLLAVPLFGAWMVYDMATVSEWESHNVYIRAYDFSYVGQTMTLGVAIMLGMLTVRRDTIERRAEMLETWPLGNATWLTAKYVALFVYLSLFTVMMIVIMLISYIRQDIPLAVIWKDVGFLAVQCELSYAVTLALGMALAAWIRHRVVYLIGFCAWMFGTFFIDLVLIERLQWIYFKTFHLSQILRNALWNADVWGASLVSEELLRSRLFVLLFTACLLSILVMTLYMRRPESGRSLARASMLVLITGLVVGGVWYGALWQERIEHYHADLAHYPKETYEQPAEQSVTATDGLPFQVDAYDLQVSQTGKREIAVHATLTLDPGQVRDDADVSFTLNHTFAVTQVQVNGKSVNFQREWDTLTIKRKDLPAADGKWTVAVNYKGEVEHYSVDPEHISHFVVDDQVFLPYFMAWYPLPGKQDLYTVHEEEGPHDERRHLISQSQTIVPGSSDMKLSLNGFSGKVYATLDNGKGKPEGGGPSQTYSGSTDRGVTLVAGNLVEVTYKEMHLITSPSNRSEGKQFLKDWHDKVVTYYDEWLFEDEQSHKIQNIFYIPLEHAVKYPVSWRDIGIAPLLNANWFLSEQRHYRLTAFIERDNMAYFYPAQSAMNVYLFNDSNIFSLESDDSNPNMTAAIRTAYVYLYVREQLHQSHDEAMYLVGDRLGVMDEEMSRELQVLEMIGQAVDSGKLGQVKKLLHDVYKPVAEFDMYTYLDQPEKGVTWHDWQNLWKEYGLGE